MSDNPPVNLPGAVPPKPPEAAKVQPKKETVRINLPPKPTAAPTIKIPAPSAPAAPAVAKAAVAAAPAAAAPPSAAPAAASPPTAAAAPKTVGAPAAVRPPGPARAPVAALSGMDKGLAIAAAVLAVAAFIRVFLLG